MRRLRALWARVLGLLGVGRGHAEIGAELESHLQMHIDDNVRAGMTRQEARRKALISLGGLEQAKQAVRDRGTLPWMEKLGREFRCALRGLWRAPGFAMIAIAVMTLGIGASVSLFTVVRSVLLRPLPFTQPGRLVALYGRDRKGGNIVAPGDFHDWQKATHGFEQMAIWRWTGFNMSGDAGELPEFLNAGAGSWNLFSTLGVSPALGRSFTPADDNVSAARTVLLSWSFFERRFNGDASIVGRTIRLNSLPYTVIGVLPAWFRFPDPKIQLWVPWQIDVPRNALFTHFDHIGNVVARLRPGVTAASALDQVNAIQHQIFVRLNGAGPVADAAIARPLLEDLTGDVKTPLYVLLAAVVCLLLIACLNLSNLLVARAAARRREAAIRSALGSSRADLIRQQLAESVLLCGLGGVLGVLVASAATRWLTTRWTNMPRAESVHPDRVVLAFVVGVTLLAGVLSGLLPALSATRAGILTALQEGSRGASGSTSRATLRRSLLTVEVALTVVLLMTAGLLFRSFLRLRSQDLGCATKNVLTVNFFFRGDKYPKAEQIVAFDTQLLEKVRSLPGVQAAGLTNVVPGGGYYGDREVWIPEHPPLAAGEHRFAAYRTADPGYFGAMEIPLIRGRFFNENERFDHDKVVIVNQELVRQDFPNEDPVGKHLRVKWRTPQGENYEIVGVVKDTAYRIGWPPRPMMWMPILSGIPGVAGDVTLVIRGAAHVEALALPIQKILAGLDPDLPVKQVLTMDEVVGDSTADSSFSAALALVFAGMALLLAAVGLYGVLAYLVTQRTAEIGVRMALGAERENVLGMVLLDGLRPALLGLALGIAASAAATRFIASILYNTSPLDGAVFAWVSATLLLTAGAACLYPAWRASRLDPMQALRSE
jgi:predicted permease